MLQNSVYLIIVIIDAYQICNPGFEMLALQLKKLCNHLPLDFANRQTRILFQTGKLKGK
jgi:hypothetical protein